MFLCCRIKSQPTLKLCVCIASMFSARQTHTKIEQTCTSGAMFVTTIQPGIDFGCAVGATFSQCEQHATHIPCCILHAIFIPHSCVWHMTSIVGTICLRFACSFVRMFTNHKHTQSAVARRNSPAIMRSHNVGQQGN